MVKKRFNMPKKGFTAFEKPKKTTKNKKNLRGGPFRKKKILRGGTFRKKIGFQNHDAKSLLGAKNMFWQKKVWQKNQIN